MSFRATPSRLVLALVVCCALHGRVAVAEEVLGNQDVLKMVGAGLGDEIIVGKIQEAPRVEFQLSVDDLVALRKAGVSERVVHAMLERSKQARPQRASPYAEVQSFGVSLKTSENNTPLHTVVGEVSSAGYGPFAHVFMNYAGLRSSVRSRDKRPVLLVSCSTAPEVGHYFLAKLDPDKRHGVRSLKIGQAVRRSGEPGGSLAPDNDWVIPFDVKEENTGTWSVSVRRDLEPGEYGWYINLETTPMGQVAMEGFNTSTPQQKCFQGGTIFDFGID
jgi:hypothetical protein